MSSACATAHRRALVHFNGTYVPLSTADDASLWFRNQKFCRTP